MPVYSEKKLVDGQKRWFIKTYVKDGNGKTVQITRRNKDWIGRDGKKEAEWEESRLKNNYEVAKDADEEIKNYTKFEKVNLAELKELYLERFKGKVDNDTLDAKRTLLDHFCSIDKTKQVDIFLFDDINDMDKDYYLKWQRQMREKKYHKGKNEYLYSIKRLNAIHGEICRMFEYAIDEGFCKTNIPKLCGKFGTPKEISLSHRKLDYETIDFSEYCELLEVSEENLRYNTYFDLEFSRGPRTGEVRAFRIIDYNPKLKQLMVNHTMSKKNELKEPKTAASKAPIDLDDSLNNKINQLINELKKQEGFNQNWFIFGGATPISSNALNNARDKYFRLAGIDKHIRLHDFRHSCATWLFSIGIPITVISKILRHASIEETLKTYTHLVKEDYINSLSVICNYKQNYQLNLPKQGQKQGQNNLQNKKPSYLKG